MPAKKRTKRKAPQSKQILTRFKKMRGSIVFWLLIVVVILGSIMLVGGILPPNTVNPDSGAYIPTTPTIYPSNYTLQLGTIPFAQCTKDAAIDFLIDESGSMAFQGKADNLRAALNGFISHFPNNGIIGMQYFSGFESDTPGAPDQPYFQNVVPINTFSNNKASIIQAIESYSPLQGTMTYDAFIDAKKTIDAWKSSNPQQAKKKLALIFISDGIPETGQHNFVEDGKCPTDQQSPPTCEVNPGQDGQNPSPPHCRCFDANEDPVLLHNGETKSIIDQLRSENVTPFTIVYLSQEDQKMQKYLYGMMTSIAGTNRSPYYNEAPTTVAEYDNILNAIVTTNCQAQ